jgi:uncharacterized protein YbjT (DUF2867 family)
VVRALTRTPDSQAGVALRGAGADVIPADFDKPASIAAAAKGADALFATGTAHRVGPQGELRHGLNVADGAAMAGIGHLVFVSGDGAAPNSPLPLFRTKHRVEEHIRSLGIRYTILAPVYLMENLFNPWNLPFLRAGSFPSPIPIGAPMQQVAAADVIALAAKVLDDPAEFTGQRIRVAALFDWLAQEGHSVDIATLYRDHPEIPWHSYADWVRSVRHRFREFCPHPALVGP